MHKGLFFRTFFCIVFFGACLYSYIDMQNKITELRIRIPKLAADVGQIDEENAQISYEIEIFESPEHLMQLARSHEFAYLKYPSTPEVLAVRGSKPLKAHEETRQTQMTQKPSITFATGSTP